MRPAQVLDRMISESRCGMSIVVLRALEVALGGVFSMLVSPYVPQFGPRANLKVLGWQNSATYGSVLSYNLYWIIVSLGFTLMLFREKRGHYPFMKAPVSNRAPEEDSEGSARSDMAGGTLTEKVAPTAETKTTDKV